MVELVSVRILGLPIQVHRAAAEHVDALQREFDLLTRSDLPPGSVPAKLLDLIRELQDEFGGIGDHPAAELQQAIEDGRDTIDLEYLVPPAVADASRRLGELLDEADRYCRSGDHLVTLATPPEARAYRQWFLGEFRAQLAGGAPTPWDRFDGPDDAPEVLGHAAPTPIPLDRGDGPSTVVLEGELDLTNAGSLRESLRSLRGDADSVVVVDLAAVTFMDSAALSVLVAAHTRFAGEGIELHVVVSPRVGRTMQLACLDTVLHLVRAPD